MFKRTLELALAETVYKRTGMLINEIFRCPVQEARGAIGEIPLLVVMLSSYSDRKGFWL